MTIEAKEAKPVKRLIIDINRFFKIKIPAGVDVDQYLCSVECRKACADAVTSQSTDLVLEGIEEPEKIMVIDILNHFKIEIPADVDAHQYLRSEECRKVCADKIMSGEIKLAMERVRDTNHEDVATGKPCSEEDKPKKMLYLTNSRFFKIEIPIDVDTDSYLDSNKCREICADLLTSKVVDLVINHTKEPTKGE